MPGFKNVLIAIDLSKESGYIIDKAMDVAALGADFHLVYVQEPLESRYMGFVNYAPLFQRIYEVEEQLREALHELLTTWAEQYGIGNTHYIRGFPAKEIHRFAEENGVDLIVLGTHGQKGLQLLLGSTANSVLHGAECDVLAIKVRPGDRD